MEEKVLAYLNRQAITVETGQVIDLEVWREQLVGMGYERSAQVDAMGQFSIRGGIIDIFPLTEETPVRIELWDDEVDTIRSFDLESQRSIEQLERITLYPAAEVVLSRNQIASGIRRLKEEEKSYERALRDQGKREEAGRIRGIIEDLTQELEDGCWAGGLDAYVKYFFQAKIHKPLKLLKN